MGDIFVPDQKGISYEDHTADLWLLFEGSSLEECMERALIGLYNAIGSSFVLGSSIRSSLDLKGKDAVEIVVDILSEALYLLDAEMSLIREPVFGIETTEEGVEMYMSYNRTGFSIPEGEGKMEVKAVSYHGAYLEEDRGQWKGRLLLDI